MIKGIEYSPESIEDLKQIEEYISVELGNKVSADKIVDKIIDKIGTLSEFPEIGAPLSSRISIKTDYRYLVCDNYNVFYRVENDLFVSQEFLTQEGTLCKSCFVTSNSIQHVPLS